MLILWILPWQLSGCAGLTTWLGNMQKQSVDDVVEQRSARFRPQFQFAAPAREALSAAEQRLVGAPPPRSGLVELGGSRYYSANGNICQYFRSTRNPVETPQPACFVNGRWQLAAPVLNTQTVKP